LLLFELFNPSRRSNSATRAKSPAIMASYAAILAKSPAIMASYSSALGGEAAGGAGDSAGVIDTLTQIAP
jgi:hypothetical protein